MLRTHTHESKQWKSGFEGKMPPLKKEASGVFITYNKARENRIVIS
jgi:hypothetical protein